MAIGGFRTVELDLTGWIALLGSGAVPGAAAGHLAARAWGIGAATGAVVAFVVARVADERRDRRTARWVAVQDRDLAVRELAAMGIPVLGTTSADVRGRHVHFVAVRDRDLAVTASRFGLPKASRRGRRRWAHARRAAQLIPPPPP